MTIIRRIGTFFILLGIALIFLFILSDIADTLTCNFLVMGAVSLIVGIILWARDPVQHGPPPERFKSMKRMMGGGGKPKDGKKQDGHFGR